jgi:hypothetical protein
MLLAENPPNYPDILGYVTHDQHALIGVVQAALALRPAVVPAGSPFEAILLLQNTTDANVEVTVSVHLPAQDAAKVKGRFVAQTDRHVTTLLPAEVGYLSIPLFVYPDTAPADNYKLGVDVRAVPLTQPNRIRQTGANNEVNLDYYFYLTDETVDRLVELQGMTYHTSRRSTLADATALIGTRLLGRTGMLGSGLEAVFSVVPPQMSKLTKAKSGWVSLWALGDSSDARPLLERHSSVLANDILPQLTRESLFRPFYRATQARMKTLYPIHQLELVFIAKLMVSVVEAAIKPPHYYDYPEQELYHVSGLIQRGWAADGSPIPIPNWCRSLLGMIGMDENVVKSPVNVLTGPLYEEVLRDAITHGIHMLYAVTGQELGTREEARIYTEYLVNLFRQTKQPILFSDVYLPLVIGGILVANDIVMPGEEPLRSFQQMHDVLLKRQEERNVENDMIFNMTEQAMAWALRRYSEWM